MGGCRCTYRNCPASTGGGLHFFHYPVFDKVRCHQWIANGRRYDLLNLKLSQLKNRVVCQRHFRDEMFMNYKKDRLTCGAVPTEDGPVLFDDSPEQSNDPVTDNKISGQDETKYYTVREKAATFSVPYKVFLEKSGLESLNDPELRKSLPSPKSKTSSTNRWVRPKMKTTMIGRLARPKVFNGARKKIKTRNPDNVEPPVKQESGPPEIQNKSSNTANNVVIISAKKISPPLPIVPLPTLEKASPSFVIKKPKKNITNNTSSSDTIIEKSEGQHSECTNYILMPEQPGAVEGVLHPVVCDPLAIEDFCPPVLPVADAQTDSNSFTVCPPIVPIITETIPDKVAAIKNASVIENTVRPLRRCLLNKSNIKVSAEKLAEIKKKRNFNMSLKEVVERTLQGVDKSCHVPAPTPSASVDSAPAILSRHLDTQASRSAGCNEAHTTQEELSSVSSTLLSAVEENKRDIAEIKRILLGRPVIAPKTSTKVDQQTDTKWSEDSKKKYLFREISQYLSASLRSSVYEELFLSTVSSKRQKVKK